MKIHRQWLFALLCLSLCCVLVSAQSTEKPPGSDSLKQPAKEDDSPYRQLVERAKSGDPTVDFVQLRDSYAAWRCNENVQTNAPNREAMVAAFEKKDYAKAVELVEVVLDYEFVQRGLHLAAEDAYRKLDNLPKADFHKSIADKLLKALLSAGDGKTTATAFRVLSVREEYVIMKELGYEVSMQGLLSGNGKPYDLLSGKETKTNKEVSVYFDISAFFGGCKKVKK